MRLDFRRLMLLGAVLLGLAAARPSAGDAQETRPITIGETHTISSRIMGEDRPIQVYLPVGYELSADRYPVLYLLDGPAHFHHTTGITQFLAQQRRAPDMIVVAIANTNRTRDLTPASTVDTTFGETGGADRFRRFITRELAPWVEERYRTADYRVLVGHSFGGLFAVHALVHEPDSFDAYVSISPSLWWNDWSLVRDIEEKVGERTGFLYMTMADEGGDMLPSAEAFAAVLEAGAADGLVWAFEHMPDEDHGSIPHRTTYDALEMLFADYRVPRNVMALGLDGLERHFMQVSETYGYDATIPENVVNQLGYQLLGTGRRREAVAAFQWNVEHYPNSPNVYDSLADGLVNIAELELAIENYERAYRMAEEISHPNAAVYRENYERVKRQYRPSP